MFTKRLIRAFYLLLLSYVVVQPAFAQVNSVSAPPVLGVCDVMNGLEALSTSIVAVRGELYIGPEALAVGDKTCTKVFEAAGKKWPNAIALGRSNIPPQDFAVDPRLTQFFDGIRGLIADLYWPRVRPPEKPPLRILVTIIGQLETRTASFGPLGFGHLATYPARLNIIAVTDVTIETVPTNVPKD